MTPIDSFNTGNRLPLDAQQGPRRRERPGYVGPAVSAALLACYMFRGRSGPSPSLTMSEVQQTHLTLPERLPRWEAQLAALPELPRGVMADLSVWDESRDKVSARAWDQSAMGGLSLCDCPNGRLEQRRDFVAEVCAVAQQKRTEGEHGLVLTDLGSGNFLHLTLQIEALLATHPRLTVQIIEPRLPSIACGNFTVDEGTVSARAPQDRNCWDAKLPLGYGRFAVADQVLVFLATLQSLTRQYGARIDIDAYQSGQTYVDAVLAGSVPKSNIITMVDPGRFQEVPWPLANQVNGDDAQGHFAVVVPAQGGPTTLTETPVKRGFLSRLLGASPRQRVTDVLAPLSQNASRAETLQALHHAFPGAHYVDHIFRQMASLNAVAPNATWAQLSKSGNRLGDGPFTFGDND